MAKEYTREIINKVAGQYLSEQDDGDYYDAYIKLKLSTEAQDIDADWIVNVWSPIGNISVEDLITLIEDGANMLIRPIPPFIQKIDWPQLRKQKVSLLESIWNYTLEAKLAIEAGEKGLAFTWNNQAETNQGLVNLIDHMQDFAVSDCGMSEQLVFNLKEE